MLPVSRLAAPCLYTEQQCPAPREGRNQWKLEAGRCCLSQVSLSGCCDPWCLALERLYCAALKIMPAQ